MTATAERSVVDVLRAARERISDPERWTKGESAKNAQGEWTTASASDACRWCAVGAVWCEAGATLMPGSPEIKALNAAVRDLDGRRGVGEVSGWPVARFNDSKRTDHGEVLDLFDRAIELARTRA
jgi:hypothetical protein